PPLESRRDGPDQFGQVWHAQIVGVRAPRGGELHDARERMCGPEHPAVEEAELGLRLVRVRLGRLAQIREHGIGDRTPRDTRPHLDAAHGQTRAPETSDMLEIAGGVACLALDDPYLVVHGAARTAAADDVAPRGL